jgi:low affinity Fe/Cu permease
MVVIRRMGIRPACSDDIHLARSRRKLAGFQMVEQIGSITARKRMPSSTERSSAEPSRIAMFFGHLANRTSLAAGRASTIILAAGVILVWAVSGPLFGFSDTWQLVINTGTTIVTFLMVFLIQNSQNRDSAAIQVKLDELIRVGAARNSLVGIEHLTDEELEELRKKCEARAKAEKAGEETVKETGKKARKGAVRVSS